MNGFADIISVKRVKDSEGFSTTVDEILASVRVYREGRHGSQRWANLAAFSEATDLFRFRVIPGVDVMDAFLRLYFNLKHHPVVLSYLLKNMYTIRNRQMLWSPDIVELNKKISDITSQSHTLALLNQQGLVDPDIFITKSNQLAEQLRNAKQQKEKLLEREDNDIIVKTKEIMAVLADGPDHLDAFDEELFCELIDKIVVESNTRIRLRLKNGLELPERIERTVR